MLNRRHRHGRSMLSGLPVISPRSEPSRGGRAERTCSASSASAAASALLRISCPAAAAYRGIFGAIKLDVEFTIDELVVASEDLAYALTRSKGTQTVLAAGTSGPESNREVFVLRRESGAWKIARYMFNKAQ